MHMPGLTTAPAEAPVYRSPENHRHVCGVGLTVWLLLATYGLDLSPGFF